MRKAITTIWVLSFSFLFISCDLVTSVLPGLAEEKELPDQIVFSSERVEYGAGIFRMDPDGTELTKLASILETEYPESIQYSEPSVSPDGDHIVFEELAYDSENENQYANIFTVNVDGTSKIKIAGNGEDYYYLPDWGPEESEIALTIFNFDEGESHIYMMNENGTDQVQVTNEGGWEPNWSPDGSRISFTDNRNGNDDIFTISPDGTELRQITESDSADYGANWSPGGERLVFVSERDGNPEIYSINKEGKELKQLTDNGELNYNPSFSPDGSEIAFTHYSDNSEKISSKNINTKVRNDRIWKGKMGKASKENTSNNYEIYKIDVEGGGQTNITVHESTDFDPEWAGVNKPEEE